MAKKGADWERKSQETRLKEEEMACARHAPCPSARVVHASWQKKFAHSLGEPRTPDPLCKYAMS